MKQLQLSEIKTNAPAEDPDDWKYRPILKTNTRTDYDSSGIEWEDMLDALD